MSDRTLLLADRNPAVVDELADRLVEWFAVVTATDGSAARRHLRTARIDAVVVGESLWGGDDGEVGVPAFLDEEPDGSTLPVVLLTDEGVLAASAPARTEWLTTGTARSHPELLRRRIDAALARVDTGIPVALHEGCRLFPPATSVNGTTEIGLEIPAPDDPLWRLAATTETRFEVTGFSPTGGRRASVTLSMTAGDVDRLLADGTTVSGVAGIRRLAARETVTVDVTDLGVVGTLTTLGGQLVGLVVDPKTVDVTLRLGPDREVRAFVEACREYPETELTARRERPEPEYGRDDVLPGDLTARQREALLAALRAGYFEWPRETTGEEIAAELGVTPPTFHQHLRKGLARVLGALTEGAE
jgi:DNA-binding transcriptional ArsR family regulator